MAKMLYSVSMSLDGYITGPDGDMQWLADFIEPSPEADALMAETGSLLVGARTFGGDDPHKGDPESEGKAFGGGWEGEQFVLTHHPPSEPMEGITFLDDLDTAIELAKAAAGDKYVNILGADVARQCIQGGVLDEVLTFVEPVILGDGVRLFAVPGGFTAKLERISVTKAPLATGMRFRVIYEEGST
jgi:dihydrofolate reductase